jgi:hypothetical protein
MKRMDRAQHGNETEVRAGARARKTAATVAPCELAATPEHAAFRSCLEALEREVVELRGRVVKLEAAQAEALAARALVPPANCVSFREVALDELCSRWERDQTLFNNCSRREPALCR